jgi:hypothetical protein
MATGSSSVAEHPPDHGARKEFERHHRRYRIAGQSDPRHPVERAEPEWGTRPHPHAPEAQLSA